MMKTKLASILRQTNVITARQEQEVIRYIALNKCSASTAILELSILPSKQLSQNIGQIFGLPIVDISKYPYKEVCQTTLFKELVLTHHILPLELSEFVLTVAVTDPTNSQMESDLQFATGKQVEMLIADFEQLTSAIHTVYGQQSLIPQEVNTGIRQEQLSALVTLSEEELDNAEVDVKKSDPISQFINQTLMEAIQKGASDVHFEPYEKRYRIRFRCDGVLVEAKTPDAQLSSRISSKIKILAKLDIAEKRLPQDGRIQFSISTDQTVDIRVSTLPTLWGEKIVLRILATQAIQLDIQTLGLSENQIQLYQSAINKPQGLILITGPTGSGKTVSLYTGLKILNTPEKNISTVEDPIEINLYGVNQVQINEKINLNFVTALRTLLRQDPDVIMVGEIRDIESAEIAIKAAQTGHLVLSTLHTNSACETITRLLNMGIDKYSLTSCLSLIIAQRLARRLCPLCKQNDQDIQPKSSYFHNPYKANVTGCPHCINGYIGRVGIYELLPMNTSIIEAIETGASAIQIEQIAQDNGFISLSESGREKLLQGITSYKELQRTLVY